MQGSLHSAWGGAVTSFSLGAPTGTATSLSLSALDASPE